MENQTQTPEVEQVAQEESIPESFTQRMVNKFVDRIEQLQTDPSTTISDLLGTPERGADESFEEYRQRLKVESFMLGIYKKGVRRV